MATAQADRSSLLEIAGLHATGPEPLPFGGGALEVRAFLLERSPGNVLIYSTSGLGDELPRLRSRGPIARHYLNHHHEAMFLPDDIAATGAPLVVNDHDRATVEAHSPLPVHSFSKRHLPDPDLEVIPTPGHTPGASAYLWEVGGHRVLFTGDSLFLRDCEWVAAVLDSSDRVAYIESLELIAGLEFDVLAPWVATAGAPPLARVEPGEARERIAAVLARVREGASG